MKLVSLSRTSPTMAIGKEIRFLEPLGSPLKEEKKEKNGRNIYYLKDNLLLFPVFFEPNGDKKQSNKNLM